MPSGIISSRLCYEAEAMIAPENEVLSTFLSALALVIGGLFSMSQISHYNPFFIF
jgi:hypothetical protein